ncbi:hypothetical protein VP496E541_P0077 [Vibrio phage 496E54-1]|nr:hypothetical protein VP495E541_P0077 [Vibrio phage 495E54-1]CAH9013205.1 hypothetical protein VP496E541_P0077 [Vibrio phage 496E54-1]
MAKHPSGRLSKKNLITELVINHNLHKTPLRY